MERPESESKSFDIGEDEDLKKKLSSTRKQLKSVGKENRPNACNPLDEEQVEELWSSGAIGLKSPQQLLNLVHMNNIRMLGMRAMKNTLTVNSGTLLTMARILLSEKDQQKPEMVKLKKYWNKIFRLDGDKKDPYRALK